MSGSTRSASININLVWILIPFTFACGIWELGGWGALAWVPAVLSIAFIASFVLMRLFGLANIPDLRMFGATASMSADSIANSMVSGIAWGAAMIFAWPDSIIGTVYLIVISVNFYLLIKNNP